MKRDNLKNSYCLKSNKPILRIPHIYSENEKLIEGIVLKFVKTKQVPQEIIEFYEKYEQEIGSNYAEIAKQLNELNRE